MRNFLFFLFHIHALGANKCSSLFYGFTTSVINYYGQQSFTPLDSFDKNNFFFLVHALGFRFSIGDSIKFLQTESTYLLSASVINQHLPPYGRVGLILRAPAKNILATSEGDLNLKNRWWPDDPTDSISRYLDRLKIQFPIISPQHLLLKTQTYNEVAIAPKLHESNVEIIALFVVLNEHPKLKTSLTSGDFQKKHLEAIEVSKELGLPLIELNYGNP